MNEVQANKFDYTQLDKKISNYLKQKESNVRKILENAYTNLGRELKEAQDELSKNGYGCFEEWYTSLGFKRNTVYELINRFKLILRITEEQIEVFEALPISLSKEMSKPSANEELNEKVFSGEITTHKEYKKLEEQLNETKNKLNKLEKEKNDLARQYKEVANKPPKIITEIKVKENRVEVISKEKEQKLIEYEREIKNYQYSIKEIEKQKIKMEQERNELEEKLSQVEECEALDLKKRKLESEKHISIFEMQLKIKNFLEEATPSLFLQGAIASSDLLMKRDLMQSVQSLELFVDKLKNIISSEIDFEEADYKEIG